MKKYMKLMLLLAATLSFLPACKKDFLDEKVYSNFTPESLNDALAFEAALVGIQNQYNLWHTVSQETASQGFLCVWQMGTDVAYNKAIPDLDPLSIAFTNYENLTSQHEAIGFAWKWGYNLINNCNSVITNLETTKANMTQAQKDLVKAEASFYRGIAYHYLATCFGAVPIITKPVTGPKTDFSRAPLAEVNKLIIDDLAFAKDKLPAVTATKAGARVNKSAASQVLAEVYLRTGDNAKAEAEADAVINSSNFKLVTARYGVKSGQAGDAFSDMFHYGNQRRSQGNTEAIWVLEIENPARIIGGTGMTAHPSFPAYVFGSSQHRRVWGNRYHQQAGMLLADSLGGRGIARMCLTYFVLDGLYGAGDMRNSHYNIRRNYWYNNPTSPNFGKLVVPGAGVDTNRLITPQITKWNQFDPNDAFGFAMIKDIILMRLAETYLMKAEAQLKQNNAAGAAATLNILRARSGAAPSAAGDVTIDFILDERARELIGEENRRMTLMRTGQLVQRAKKHGQKVTNIDAKHLLLPIPLSEIQLNKDGKLEQNPGY